MLFSYQKKSFPFCFRFMISSNIEMASVACLLLLIVISSSQARPEGATNTSCYNHVITHTFFGQVLQPVTCTANVRCSGIALTPSCPTMQDDVCCKDFNRNILYTNCNYTCKYKLIRVYLRTKEYYILYTLSHLYWGKHN